VANKERTAVALAYESEKDAAPRVVATGRGELADRILAIAREHGIPIRQEPKLVETLASLEMEQEIPPELYAAVAEILAFVYRLTGKGLADR
jgi:flagellar biosynthesis protein